MLLNRLSFALLPPLGSGSCKPFTLASHVPKLAEQPPSPDLWVDPEHGSTLLFVAFCLTLSTTDSI